MSVVTKNVWKNFVGNFYRLNLKTTWWTKGQRKCFEMKVLRYFVSTRKKQWRLFLLCIIVFTVAGYLYWLSLQPNSITVKRGPNTKPQNTPSPWSASTSPSVNNIEHFYTTLAKPNKFVNGNKRRKRSFTKQRPTKHQMLSTVKDINPIKASHNVHIFYYPWFGNPTTDGKYIHWNHEYLPHWNKEVAARYKHGIHVPPDDIGSDFYPELGCYSSSDENTIREHMQQIRASGAGVVVVSWYPEHKADQQGIPVDRLVPKLLNIAAEYGLKVTLHIEPYKDRNELTVRDDAIYIHKKYAQHPALYKYKTADNRHLPLLYVYDSYHTKPHDWANLLKPGGKYTIRNTPHDCFMIALMVEFSHKDYINTGGFDGFYTYFAVNGFTYGSRWDAWSRLKSFADQTNTVFIPSVGPGYIDTSIRPWNSANTRSRENGDYYRRSFRAALSVQPPLISVTSFNEWHEGTQIERAIPKTGNSFKYKDYSPNGPDYYLKLTRTYVEKFEKWDEK